MDFHYDNVLEFLVSSPLLPHLCHINIDLQRDIITHLVVTIDRVLILYYPHVT